MSNNKDFLVNGPVVVGKDTKVTVGSIAAGTVDLSTGNYFVDTPTGDYTYTFANPGDVQAFQIEATGGSDAVAETFSTTLYTGNGTTQTIDNGLDLSGDGGLVWVKDRDAGNGHNFYDTERGATKRLASNLTSAETTRTNGVTSFNSNGFSGGNDASINTSGNNYVSWSFKKQAKFFDVVTWTGDGSASRNISHNLGATVGTIIVKRYNTTEDWVVFHRSLGANNQLKLNKTDAAGSLSGLFISTPTDSVFTVGSNSAINANGSTYVAYLFAHDTASDGLIQCGSTTQVSGGTTVDLGWEPQWVLIRATTASHWFIFDNQRGGSLTLLPNLSNAEGSQGTGAFEYNSTGFTMEDYITGSVGDTLIYIAIRAAAAPAITWPTNIEWPAGITPSTPAEGETDVYTFTTDDGGTTYTGVQSIDNAS